MRSYAAKQECGMTPASSTSSDPHDPLGAAGHGAAVVVLAPPAGGEDLQSGGIGSSASPPRSSQATGR